MKKQILSLTLLLVFFTGIKIVNARTLTDQTRPVSGFTAIASSGAFHVYVKIDGKESLKISADDDIIDKIETVVENGTLKIRYKKDWGWHNNGDHKADIYVSAKSLSSLVNSGSGSIKVEGFITTSDFKAVLSGSGSIATSVKASEASIVISGSGDIYLSGKVDVASVSISGSGSVKARELKTDETKISISGSGDVAINAEKELSSSIMGSGSVTYTGNPSIHTSKMGSGSVTRE